MRNDFLKNIQDKDLEKLKSQEKAVRKSKKSVLILNKKRKRKVEPSRIATVVKELVKRKVKDIPEIQKYFTENYQTIGNESAKFYKTIVNTKVMNNNIKISDTLTNQPLYDYICGVNFTTTCISNDILYSVYLLERIKDLKDEFIDNKFEVNGIIDQITFCSLPFLCNGDIKKGYYQDYNGNFAAIGLDGPEDFLQKVQAKENELLSIDFEYNSTQYSSKYSDGYVVIYPKSMNGDQIKAIFNKMKILSTKNKISLNEKSISVSNKVRYIDCTTKTQDFCPAFLKIPNEVKFSILFRIKYDYNKLYDDIQKKCQANNRLVFPENLFYWDTLHQSMDFICILALTSSVIDDGNKTNLAQIYDKYIDLKEVLDLWKQNQLLYQRTLKEFYVSFNNILNYDKLMSLRDKIRDYIDVRDSLKKDETYPEVKDFIRMCQVFGFCKCVNIQMDDKVFSVADEMYAILNRLNESDTVNLVNDLKRVGFAIYNLTYLSDDQKSMQAFPFILSPGGFLGNVVTDINEDPLTEIINNLQARLAKKDDNERTIEEKIDYLANNKSQIQTQVLIQSVRKYLQDTGNELNDNNIRTAANIIYNAINNDKSLEAELDRNIQKNILSGKDVDSIIIPSKNIGNYVQKYLLDMKDKELRQKQNIINTNKQINNLQKNIFEYDMDDDEETKALTEKNDKQKQYMNMIRDGKLSVLDVDPKLVSQWYRDILVLSNFYKLDKNTINQLANADIQYMMNNLKIGDDVLSVIIDDFGLPTLDKVIETKTYVPSKKIPAEQGRYSNSDYIKKRLNEIRASRMRDF